MIDVGRIGGRQKLALRDGRAAIGAVRGRADLEVGLAEHRRRRDEDLRVAPELAGPAARQEDEELDVLAVAVVIVDAHGAAHFADVAAGEPHFGAGAQRPGRRQTHAHVEAGADGAIGQHEHPRDGRRQRDDDGGAGPAAHGEAAVVERWAQRH